MVGAWRKPARHVVVDRQQEHWELRGSQRNRQARSMLGERLTSGEPHAVIWHLFPCIGGVGSGCDRALLSQQTLGAKKSPSVQ